MKENNRSIIDLLMRYGVKVPDILNGHSFTIFDNMMVQLTSWKGGMDPSTMSWHHVSILHDMAQKMRPGEGSVTLKVWSGHQCSR